MKMKRLLAIGLVAAAAFTSTAVAAGNYGYPAPGRPVFAPYDPYRPDAPRNGGRDAADPAYSSPYSSSNLNPSVAGRTGTYADDGACMATRL